MGQIQQKTQNRHRNFENVWNYNGLAHFRVNIRGTRGPCQPEQHGPAKGAIEGGHGKCLTARERPAELRSGSGSEGAPFARQTVELTKQAYIELKWAASYWKAQYDRVTVRETALKQEVEAAPSRPNPGSDATAIRQKE